MARGLLIPVSHPGSYYFYSFTEVDKSLLNKLVVNFNSLFLQVWGQKTDVILFASTDCFHFCYASIKCQGTAQGVCSVVMN